MKRIGREAAIPHKHSDGPLATMTTPPLTPPPATHTDARDARGLDMASLGDAAGLVPSGFASGPLPPRHLRTPPHPAAPSTPRPAVPERGDDRAFTAAGLLAATGAIAIGVVLMRWALAATKRSAVQRPEG